MSTQMAPTTPPDVPISEEAHPDARVARHEFRQQPPDEVNRRIAQVRADLYRARQRMRHARQQVRAAEEVVLARRLAFEAAALRAADLAELLDSLQATR